MRTHYFRGQHMVTQAEVERSFEERVPACCNMYIRQLQPGEVPPHLDDRLQYIGLFDADGDLVFPSLDIEFLYSSAKDEDYTVHALN